MVLEILKAAMAVPATPKTGPFGGCGRVYVTLSMGKDRKLVNAVAAAAKELGLIFQREAYYGMTNALYIGYDNADGRAMAKGEAVAKELTARGIPAYMDAHGD